MCDNKRTFRSRHTAVQHAEKYNQKVYECPICFCFHCTTRENWRDEFVTIEKYNTLLVENEKLRKEGRNKVAFLGKELAKKNEQIRLLKLKIKNLRNDLR